MKSLKKYPTVERICSGVLLGLAKGVAWVLAKLPERGAELMCNLAGDVAFFLTSRGDIAIRNLHHAFPDRPLEWHERIARLSCRRMMEMFLFAAASAYFTKERFAKVVTVTASQRAQFIEASRNRGVMVIAHTTLMEALVYLPTLVPETPTTGVFFRPIDTPAIDEWIKTTRERWGSRLLARTNDLPKLMQIVRENGWAALLFDQNTGTLGTLTTFFDRVCSATELPGLISKKFGAQPYAVYPRRTGFWRASLEIHKLPCDTEVNSVVIAAQKWLEKTLTENDDCCASWLWPHNRWKFLTAPEQRLFLGHKKSALPIDKPIPRRFRLWVRCPDSLEGVLACLPGLRAIRKSRPDAEITLLVSAVLAEWLQRIAKLNPQLDIFDKLIRVPTHVTANSYTFYSTLSNRFPDTWLDFNQNPFSGKLARKAKIPQRFGLAPQGSSRPGYTHLWAIHEKYSWPAAHPCEMYSAYLQSFGLREPPIYTPLLQTTLKPIHPGTGRRCRIAFFCHASSGKTTWSVDSWHELLSRITKELPLAECELLGFMEDDSFHQAICRGLDPERVHNRTGTMNLQQITDLLVSCHLTVGSPSQGLSLANAIGVPCLGIYPNSSQAPDLAYKGSMKLVRPSEGMALPSVETVWALLSGEEPLF